MYYGKILSWENANTVLSQKKPNHLNKIMFNLPPPPSENLDHPDKKLNSLGIILIPWKNIMPPEKIPIYKNNNSPIEKVSTTQSQWNNLNLLPLKNFSPPEKYLPPRKLF